MSEASAALTAGALLRSWRPWTFARTGRSMGSAR